MAERASGLRVRTTAAAVAVVAVALVVAAVAMVAFLGRSLRSELRTAAVARAEAVAGVLGTNAAEGTLDAGDPEEEFVQVLGDDGTVTAASSNVRGHAALARIPPGEALVVERVPFEDESFLAVAVSASGPDRPLTVVVGRGLDDIDDATAAATRALAVGIPVLVLLVGAVTWRVVGRSLAPVERIREEVESISGAELHRRVPTPPGDDEIARLAATMNRMLERLEDAQGRQRRFVSDASHELRSPIASIRQHAELARTRPEGEDARGLAEVVLEEDLRLQRTVEDLLLLARIDEGTASLRAEPVDLDDLVLDAAARLRASTGLRVDAAGVSAGRVLGDRDRLERLIRNLTENAIRVARTGVSLALREDVDDVILAIEDDGPGIAPADRERVFDRFVRLDDARDRDSGGSGLGLAIVREIAALHRGTVAVNGGALGGARFEVRLPRLPD